MRSDGNKFKKGLAELALYLFLRTALPAVYAMSQIERREWNRPAIVQVYSVRYRRRALDRREGLAANVHFGYQFT
jgi:hypothetical protein